MFLVYNEGQVFDQWQDRNVSRREKGYIATKWNKSPIHIFLINALILDSTNGSEALKLLPPLVFQFGGIKERPIAGLHPL